MSWTFGRKLALGFAIAVLAVLVIGISGHRSVTDLIENDRWVEHTQEVRRAVAQFMASLREAESNQRGYVLTGDERFLDSYRESVNSAEKSFNEARRLTTDNDVQQRRFATMGPVVDARLSSLATVIELRKTQGLETTSKSHAFVDGKDQMDSIHRLVLEIDQAEGDLLSERQQRSVQSATSTQATILWGSVLGIGMIALAGFVLSRSLTSQVGVVVRHIQTSSAELQAAASQQAAGAKQQATALNEVTTTISELLATSRQIAESAQRVADIAAQTASQTRAGDATVTRGSEAVNAIKRQVDAIVSHMLELGKKSQQIGSVLDIVAELAEQTNILAINATIEAAGAGEAGRRFGVVADEIRKLADRVSGSTKEIRALIDDVRAAVNTTVMTTETGSKAALAGSEQFGEVQSSFRQISGQVSTTTEAAKEIELSTKQQASAVEQVNIAITNVASASKESEVSTGQTLRTASELATLSRDLLRIVEAQRGELARANAAA
ncbi:MAG TPA: CHASE3 domain-containing protein [Polyangiaceae bacterium]|nr:CHASE3 domain-containing protein [Polyangiaceae bacterium]